MKTLVTETMRFHHYSTYDEAYFTATRAGGQGSVDVVVSIKELSVVVAYYLDRSDDEMANVQAMTWPDHGPSEPVDIKVRIGDVREFVAERVRSQWINKLEAMGAWQLINFGLKDIEDWAKGSDGE